MSKNKFLKVASNLKGRSIICFLRFKKGSLIGIYCELKAAYGDNVMSIQNVQKWCRLFHEWREVTDITHSIVTDGLGLAHR